MSYSNREPKHPRPIFYLPSAGHLLAERRPPPPYRAPPRLLSTRKPHLNMRRPSFSPFLPQYNPSLSPLHRQARCLSVFLPDPVVAAEEEPRSGSRRRGRTWIYRCRLPAVFPPASHPAELRPPPRQAPPTTRSSAAARLRPYERRRSPSTPPRRRWAHQ